MPPLVLFVFIFQSPSVLPQLFLYTISAPALFIAIIFFSQIIRFLCSWICLCPWTWAGENTVNANAFKVVVLAFLESFPLLSHCWHCLCESSLHSWRSKFFDFGCSFLRGRKTVIISIDFPFLSTTKITTQALTTYKVVLPLRFIFWHLKVCRHYLSSSFHSWTNRVKVWLNLVHWKHALPSETQLR